MTFVNTDAAILAAFPNAQPGQQFTIGGQSYTYGGGSKQSETNAKLPDDAWTAGRSKPKYPHLYREMDALGKSIYVYRNPESPQTAFEQSTDHSGVVKTSEVSPSYKGMVTSINYENRSYTVGGSSTQTDGHNDTNIEATDNHNVAGDAGSQVGQNRQSGTGGKVMAGTGEGSFHYDTGGHTYKASNGDIISDHTGNFHSNYEGDQVESITGNKHVIVSSGEYGITVQNGNMDIDALTGQLHIHATQTLTVKSTTTVIIEGPVNLTLKSGASSITMTPSSIIIKSPSIQFQQG